MKTSPLPAPSRRQFLGQTLTALAGTALASTWSGCSSVPKPAKAEDSLFKISLAEWSLHRAIRDRNVMDHLDFPVVARQAYGIDAVEYVNQFFMDKANDQAYLGEMQKRCDGEGVTSLLIMVDGEGNLGDADAAARRQTVENHHKWAEAAKFLGCHSIRVNAATGNQGTFQEQQQRAADGLRQLSEFAAGLDLNVIVENHGGLSSHGTWLAGVMEMVDLDNCGTLPDFGNFTIREGEVYNKYRGVAQMMPYAKAVSAKAYDFDLNGNEINIEYRRMMRIVLHSGYRGYVGIEYEGYGLREPDGILATKRLLETVRSEMANLYS